MSPVQPFTAVGRIVDGADPSNPAPEITVVTLEAFIGVEEPGADPILGEPDNILIPEGGDVMCYGDGGAGKTTLTVDLAFHLASGTDWLGMTVPAPVRVGMIENEGPRPLFRQKLRRKHDAWQGAPVDGRLMILERPWGQFTFADPEWRAELAATVRSREIDVILAGPLTRIGMDSAGTLQEVVAFMRSVQDVRAQCRRPFTLGLTHHDNKGGTVSGAWEGAGDTLLHVEARGNGYTTVHIQKARWSSKHHNTTLELAWTDGEGFRLKEDRSVHDEIIGLLSDASWRTAKEIAAPKDKGGIGANVDTVKDLLEGHPDDFTCRTGDAARAVGRHPSAAVWQVTQGPKSPESATDSVGGGGEQVTPDSTLRESGVFRDTTPRTLDLTQTPESANGQPQDASRS